MTQMRMLLFFICLQWILIQMNAIASDTFCQSRETKTLSLASLDNTLALDNEGGLFGLNTGVCWWNSWFLLRANYQLKFAPECPGPDVKTKDGRKFYRKIYLNLLSEDKIQIVPAYKNLRELTSDPYQKYILQQALQRKMAHDSFFRFTFIEALEGRGHWRENEISETRKSKLIKRQMSELDRTASFIEKFGPAYVMLQNPGISTHALIIFKIEKKVNDYVIYAQDSNFQSRLSQVPHAPYRILNYRDGQWFDDKYGQKLSFHLYLKREKQVIESISRYEKFCQVDDGNNYCPAW